MQRAADINFECAGNDGPTIVCLHGIGGNSDSFAPQLAYFSKRARVVAWNMPGYGDSAPLSNMTFESLANSLLALIDSLDCETVHIVGQSIGGMIAQEFAIRYPQRVESLALIATTPAFGGRDETFKTAFLKARLAPLDGGQKLADLAGEFVPQIVGPDTSESTLNEAVQSMAAVPEDSYRDTLTCLVTFNRRDDLQSIMAPCCVIAGSHDTNAPAKTMEKMASKIPHAQYHCIASAGHLVNLEYPDETNAILESFWNIG